MDDLKKDIIRLFLFILLEGFLIYILILNMLSHNLPMSMAILFLINTICYDFEENECMN